MTSAAEFPDELFQPTDDGGDDPTALREALLHRTLGVVRTRRRMRKVAFAATLVGCYVTGAATILMVRPQQTETELTAAVGPESGQPTPDMIADANLERELAALTPYERLRRVGHRLEDRGELVAAARTYRDALDVAQAHEQAIEPTQDSLLLMAIKNQ